MAKKLTYEPISDQSTVRSCTDCGHVASQWRYSSNLLGGVDKSSRQPVCVVHGKKD